MIKNRITLLLLILPTLLMADADLDVLMGRLKEDYITTVPTDSALNIMRQQLHEGYWENINYRANKGPWPSKHLKNLKAMAAAYNKEEFAQKKDSLREGILKGLAHWYGIKPVLICDNWWVNDIGNQLDLNPIAIMMWKDIPQFLRNKLIDNNQERSAMTGANEAWISANVAVRGLLEHNAERVKTGIEGIAHSVEIVEGEGQQVDHSFYQHGRLLYNGGYGLAALSITSLWAKLTRDTDFSFSPEQINAMALLALDGDRWMIWEKSFDVMSTGRGISRLQDNAKVESFTKILENLSVIDSSRSLEYENFIDHINGINRSSLEGNKYFWRGDFMVKRLPNFYSSLKMSSDATVGSEFMNRENKKGYWLGMGVNMIYHQWDDYKDIYPIWDWSKLPGVTNYSEIPEMSRRMTNLSPYAGGVSDGTNGVAGMIAQRPLVRAHKSWFFFRNIIVALGSGIEGSSRSNVTTTIDQRLSRTSVYSEFGVLSSSGFDKKTMKMLWHDSIGYLSLDKQFFFVSDTIQHGNWADIGTEHLAVSKRVLKIWMDHGIAPASQKYSYLVVLGIDSLDFKKKTYSEIKVLQNDTMVQAIYDTVAKTLGSVFYMNGNVSFESGVNVEVSAPCILILQEFNEKYRLSISTPIKSVDEVQVTIKRVKENGEASVSLRRIKMPSGAYAGSVQTVEFDFKSFL
jgi:chondroitin AC lyase